MNKMANKIENGKVFAAVYIRRFGDISTFMKELKKL
jgi:hypothetical protein